MHSFASELARLLGMFMDEDFLSKFLSQQVDKILAKTEGSKSKFGSGNLFKNLEECVPRAPAAQAFTRSEARSRLVSVWPGRFFEI